MQAVKSCQLTCAPLLLFLAAQKWHKQRAMLATPSTSRFVVIYVSFRKLTAQAHIPHLHLHVFSLPRRAESRCCSSDCNIITAVPELLQRY